MNGYALIILAALVVDCLVSLVADRLNLKHQPELPPAEFADLIEPAAYRKSREYLKATTRLDQIAALFNLAVLVLFWFLEGFNRLDLWCREIFSGPLASGLLFIALLLAGRSLLNLPFSLYQTFVIEERFGFNRTDWKTFLLDRVKMILLGVLLGGPLLALILWFLESAGDRAWLYAWLVTAGFTLIIQFLAPTWIMPLFNKFTPLEDGELKEALAAYGRRVGFPLDRVFVIDGSRRSAKGNAFFTGFGRSRRVALYDTLIAQHSPAELVAILAHEIGHYRKKHILIMTALALVHQGIIFFLLGWVIRQPGIYSAFFMQHPSPAAGLVFFGLLYTPVEMLLNPLFNALSRQHEFAADAFAVTSLQECENLVAALKKLARDNLANLAPHPFYVFLHYSHPPLLARIREMRRRLRAGGPPANPENPVEKGAPEPA